MLGQQAFGNFTSSTGIHSVAKTVQVKPARATFAEVALTRVNDIETGDGVWGHIGITQMVSDSGVENFDPVRQGVFRQGVTSVTFEVFVWNSFARGRMFLNFWS